MSSKSNPPAHSGAKHAAHGEHVSSEELDHQDDLIVAPKGANRTRFILTVILVLFVLVMFVVADLFQYVVGGSSRGGQNPTYVTWRDPVQGADESVNAMDFELTRRLLSQLAYMGLYQPDSYAYSERASRRAAPDVTEADVASFLVFEDLAKDAGITTSEKEHRDLLLARFQSGANLVATAREFQMTAKQLEDAIRRVRSVEKLKEFMRTGTRLADPDAMLESWQSQHQQHKFQYTALSTDAFAADAAAETLPDDEALLTWWRTRPPFEQQQLWSEEKTIPQVAWLDLSGSFDATALLEAFPRPEGLDETQLARTYYNRYRAVRFLDPTPPPTEPGDDTPDDADKPSPYLEFEAVQEDALREARVEASLVDFLADLKERTDKGEESIDLAVEAAKYGLESYTSPDAMTRAELAAAPGWGNQNLAQRLAFGPEGQVLPSVVVDGSRMYLGRVLERTKREEQPLDAIRAQVNKKWITERSIELAEARASALVEAMATKPTPEPGAEDADSVWNPVVDEETFRRVITEAGLEVVERDWLERQEVPGGNAALMSDGDRFMRDEAAAAYLLPEGAVSSAMRNRKGDKVYLVRHVGERAKPADQLTTAELANLPNMIRYQERSDLEQKVFLGDSEWFKQRFQLRFPELERREAEKAAKPAS